ncbi:MAG TPA: NAD(P)-dependent oxidoreductase [Verrucomicrobiae bacterium]|nr:NAD(P)-dependent oxidoreductase [Verrucomicrobiae bacterium]
MKVALIGATGFVGSKILAEALRRGHQVTAIERRPGRLAAHPNLRALKIDVLHRDELARVLRGHDVLISSFNPARGVPGPEVFQRHVRGHKAIIAAAKKAGVRRFLAVGGAASLKTPAGIELLDSPDFPAAFEPFKPGIRGTRELYYLLKKEPGLDWIFLSPSVMIVPGRRTNQFRLGTDHILYDASGKSHISLQDYAVAMLDEMEHPKHHRQRFTVGY